METYKAKWPNVENAANVNKIFLLTLHQAGGPAGKFEQPRPCGVIGHVYGHASVDLCREGPHKCPCFQVGSACSRNGLLTKNLPCSVADSE